MIDTGSEISVISENVMGELREVNKNIPSLPVAGVTVVGVTGVRSKRITRQVQLNILINEVKVTGIKMIHKQVGDGEIETKINTSRE